MSKKRKTFKPVRIEPSGGTPIKGPALDQAFTLKQVEARQRFLKQKKRLSFKQVRRRYWESKEDFEH
jgi:hypothetical protein